MDYNCWRQAVWYRLWDEGLRRRHCGGQAPQEELCQTSNQKGITVWLQIIKHEPCHPAGDVRPQQARGPAQRGGVEGVHDVSQQTAFRVFFRQGALLPWRDNLRQCSHSGEKFLTLVTGLTWLNCIKIRPQLCRLHQKMLLAFIQVACVNFAWSMALVLS